MFTCKESKVISEQKFESTQIHYLIYKPTPYFVVSQLPPFFHHIPLSEYYGLVTRLPSKV